MPRTYLEEEKPSGPQRSAKRLVAGVSITAVALVAIGSLAWVRFQPAFSQQPVAAIAVSQPEWGTTSGLVPSAAPAAAESKPAGTATAAKTTAATTDARAKAKTKAQAANGQKESPKSRMPTQVAKTP